MSAPSVTLRPLEPQDAEVIATWAADRQLCREAGWTPDLSPAEYRRFHEDLVRSLPAELIRLGAICDGRLIGYVDLHGSESHRRELGFLIGDRRRWGLGLGSAAAAAGVQYGFERLGLTEIWAEALDANARAVRILLGLGMTETGRGGEGVFLDRPTYYRRFAITVAESSYAPSRSGGSPPAGVPEPVDPVP